MKESDIELFKPAIVIVNRGLEKRHRNLIQFKYIHKLLKKARTANRKKKEEKKIND